MIRVTNPHDMRFWSGRTVVLGLVVLIAAHALIVWRGAAWSARIGTSLPWIAGGVLVFVGFHAAQAYGAFHMIRRIRGRPSLDLGQHGGQLLDLGHGFIEVAISREGRALRFRLFC